MKPKYHCPDCGLAVKESMHSIGISVRSLLTCDKCGGRLTPQVCVSEDDIIDHLIRMDNATLLVYDDPGLTLAAMNLEDVGRIIFTIYYQRGYVACADLHK